MFVVKSCKIPVITQQPEVLGAQHLLVIQNDTRPGREPESALCFCNFKSLDVLVKVPGWGIRCGVIHCWGKL